MKKFNIGAYKIGGAGLENALRFNAVGENIVPIFEQPKNILVCSATKGSTRKLVSIFESKKAGNIIEVKNKLDELYETHLAIIMGLSIDKSSPLIEMLDHIFYQIEDCTFSYNRYSEEETYAVILQFGEILSSRLLSLYLKSVGIENVWFSARRYIKTTGHNGYSVIHLNSEELISNTVPKMFERSNLLITQGFIARDYESDRNTILPFDGSDTSAAFFAHSIEAEQMTFFKDVCGVCVNDHPMVNDINHIHDQMTFGSYLARFEKKEKYPVRPDAIEILSRRGIPTRICSFLYPTLYGTQIRN